MDLHPVVQNGHPSVFHLLAILELGRSKINVIGLPAKRWITHVQVRGLDAVNPSTLVVPSLKAKGIEHLHLITTLQIAPAIAATLSASLGLEWQEKLNV
jgi:hypothetical protein